MSWGFSVDDNIISLALDSAANFGRNGKGCVLVACSHNYNTNPYFPSRKSNVIAVGAINQLGTRNTNSNYGTSLDVVGPGFNIYTTGMKAGRPVEIDNGAAGVYDGNFNATSAATPFVAGVAALVLSVNPNLTALEVRNIIAMTAQKLNAFQFITMSGYNNGTRDKNNEVGYGLVDAHASVQAATCISSLVSQTISSNRFARSCNNLFSVQNVTVSNNATLAIKSNETSINGTFEVLSGSMFEIR
jgi:subtilisin family serine protease